jgi:protein TonB
MQFLEGVPYRVQVEVHCDDTVDACAAFLEQTRRMPAPQPPFPSTSGMETASWEESMHAWRRIVLSETCEAGARHVPPPRYPQSALRQGIAGKVVLNLLANPCGEVREAVVEVSSGSRDLDRAALDVARQWRVSMPADVPAGSGARLRVPITFDDGDPGEAALRTAPGKSAQ